MDETRVADAFSGLDHRMLDYLVELGRLRGYVGPAELEQAFPQQRLSASQIHFCRLYVEQAGVPVRLPNGQMPSVAREPGTEAERPRFLEPRHISQEDLALATTAALLMAGYAAAHMSGWV